MDDEQIRKLTKEVLADLSRPAEKDAPGLADLEARVAALEATLREIRTRLPAAGAAPIAGPEPGPRGPHPSAWLFNVGPATKQCVMEPDKPCVQSGACRTLGH